MPSGYDVFVSHAWVDRVAPRSAQRPLRAAVNTLVAELRAGGLSVFFDETEIEPFAPLRASIVEALTGSKVLVAWCSDAYLTRLACAAELTLAVCASLASPQPRVLVVNTEATTAHIPEMLLANLVPGATTADLATTIAHRCRACSGPIGAATTAPTWLSPPPMTSTRFTGRVPEMWKLHAALTANEFAGQVESRGRVVVDGLGGCGKSLLASEYAHRFAAAWPGGIVWMAADRTPAAAYASLALHLGVVARGAAELESLRPAVAAAIARARTAGCCGSSTASPRATIHPSGWRRWRTQQR